MSTTVHQQFRKQRDVVLVECGSPPGQLTLLVGLPNPS